MDIHKGFYNIHVAEGNEWKATFKTNSGLYKPTVMQFGLKNAPTVFQRMINTQFANIIAQGNIIIYFNDILIATKDNLEAHRKVVSQVLDRLQKLYLYLKPSKCVFKTRRIEFHGVIPENGTVMMDPIKVSSVREWKVPTNTTENHAFQGSANFYCRFIPNFSKIARLFNDLLKTGVKWHWGEEQQKAFEEIKKLIMSEPVLCQPDQTKPFKVKVDASNYIMGTVLMQRDEKNVLHPVAFFSKSMNKAQCNYDIYNKELLGLWEMLRHRHQYLFQPQHKVQIYTDHTNLLFWKNPGEHNRRVARWHVELMEYDFKLVHITGTRNGWADALSRCPDYDKGNEDNKKLMVLPEHFFAQDVHVHLAGTEWADPHNPEEW